MRRFVLVREVDETGVSGTGTVAEGVQFTGGRVAVRWIVGEHRSTVTWDDIVDVLAIHGHNGATTLQWVDTDLTESAREVVASTLDVIASAFGVPVADLHSVGS